MPPKAAETSIPFPNRYRGLSSFLRQSFGSKVRKIPLDAGLSCPNRDGKVGSQGCSYCDPQGSGTGAWQRGMGITQQIQAYLRGHHTGKVGGYLAYFQSFSNTYASLEKLRALYEEAISFPQVVGLCIGTRPDCLDEPVLDLLSELNLRTMVWLELGLQSAHDETLRKIRRGHDFRAFKDAVDRASSRGLLLCTHLILGLPGETREHVRSTAQMISALPIHGLKLHGLYIVRGTHMESLFREGIYEPWSLEQYADGVCDVLELIPSDWVIHRLCSDPDPQTLVAPEWMLNKQATLERIHLRLLERDTWQGKLF